MLVAIGHQRHLHELKYFHAYLFGRVVAMPDFNQSVPAGSINNGFVVALKPRT